MFRWASLLGLTFAAITMAAPAAYAVDESCRPTPGLKVAYYNGTRTYEGGELTPISSTGDPEITFGFPQRMEDGDRISVRGHETLTVGDRTLDTLIVVRVSSHKKGYTREVTYWFSPELCLIVKGESRCFNGSSCKTEEHWEVLRIMEPQKTSAVPKP